MVKILRIKILYLFLLQNCTLFAQRIFVCDSTLSSDNSYYFGQCAYYYNFIEGRKDSIPKTLIYQGSEIAYNPIIQIYAPVNSDLKIHGVVKGFHEHKLIFQIPFRNGVADGYYVWKDGSDTLGYAYIQGQKKKGTQVLQSSIDRSFRIEQPYIDGLAEGAMRIFEKGRLVGITNYKAGKRHGASYTYHDSGRLESLLVYEDDIILDGIYYVFWDNGKIFTKLAFKDNKNIQTIYYDEDGVIIRVVDN
jgi:MORN repeat variant